MIYFDNAATSYPKPDSVYEAVKVAMKKYSFNAGRGSYQCASETFKMIEDTREKIADLVNTTKEKVVFTSSATESLNNIIYGLNLKKDDNVYVSPFEHNAIIRTLHNVGVNIKIIPFDKNTWELDKNLLKSQMLLSKPKCVIISHISNVTGFKLPYEEIFSISKFFNAINILDSAQAFGVHSVDTKNLDFVVFAGHKSLRAIFGIAGYVNINSINLKTYKVGGTGSDSMNPDMPLDLPSRYEAGSMNSIAIFSLNVAIGFIKKSKFDIIEREITNYFIKQASKLKKIIIYIPKDYIPNGIVSFNVYGYSSDEVGMILAEDYDICVRTGFHCSPYVHEFIGSLNYNGTVRLSFSGFNTTDEVDILINALKTM